MSEEQLTSELAVREPREAQRPKRRDADLFLNDSEVFTFDFAAGEEEPIAQSSDEEAESVQLASGQRDTSSPSTSPSASRRSGQREHSPSQVAEAHTEGKHTTSKIKTSKASGLKTGRQDVSVVAPLTAEEVRRYAMAARQAGPTRFLTLPHLRAAQAQNSEAKGKASDAAAAKGNNTNNTSNNAVWAASFDEVAEVFTKNLRRYDEKLRLAQKMKKTALRRTQNTKRARNDK